MQQEKQNKVKRTVKKKKSKVGMTTYPQIQFFFFLAAFETG